MCRDRVLFCCIGGRRLGGSARHRHGHWDNSKGRGQRSEVRGQMSEVRGQRSEVGAGTQVEVELEVGVGGAQ